MINLFYSAFEDELTWQKDANFRTKLLAGYGLNVHGGHVSMGFYIVTNAQPKR